MMQCSKVSLTKCNLINDRRLWSVLILLIDIRGKVLTVVEIRRASLVMLVVL